MTARFPWITLAPQESRNNHLDGNRPGPEGKQWGLRALARPYTLVTSLVARLRYEPSVIGAPLAFQLYWRWKSKRNSVGPPRLDVHLAWPWTVVVDGVA